MKTKIDFFKRDKLFLNLQYGTSHFHRVNKRKVAKTLQFHKTSHSFHINSSKFIFGAMLCWDIKKN